MVGGIFVVSARFTLGRYIFKQKVNKMCYRKSLDYSVQLFIQRKISSFLLLMCGGLQQSMWWVTKFHVHVSVNFIIIISILLCHQQLTEVGVIRYQQQSRRVTLVHIVMIITLIHNQVQPRIQTYTLLQSLSFCLIFRYSILCTKATIHQVTTMLATSKSVLFPGHNHHANHRY